MKGHNDVCRIHLEAKGKKCNRQEPEEDGAHDRVPQKHLRLVQKGQRCICVFYTCAFL